MKSARKVEVPTDSKPKLMRGSVRAIPVNKNGSIGPKRTGLGGQVASVDKGRQDSTSRRSVFGASSSLKAPEVAPLAPEPETEPKPVRNPNIKVLGFRTQVFSGLNYMVRVEVLGKPFSVTIWEKSRPGNSQLTGVVAL